MKHAALLATGLVGAVLLIQGTSSFLAAPGTIVGGVDFTANTTSTNTSIATTDSTGLPLVAISGATKPAPSSAPATTKTPASSSVTGTTADSTSFTQSSSESSTSSIGRDDSSARSDSAPAGGAQVHTQISAWTSSTSPGCPIASSGSTAGAPGDVSVDDIPGTNTADMNSFANEYNANRVADCLQPIPYANIRFSSCLEQRLFWMADDPSPDPYSAWGHTGTAHRSDGVPIVGCDGDLAGGSGFTGASVADAWWNSPDHRASLYQPDYKGSFADVCIYFALTHGGYNNPGPNEPYSFTRAAAYWGTC